MIRINSLEKFFNKGKENEIHVINDVTLELPKSGMVAIFGRSGCGKTTLLNVLGGLDGFSGGSVLIDGNDIKSNTDEIRNKYVGYIFQNYNLSKGESCFDNVANALRLCGMNDEEEIAKRVNSALANVGMEKYAKRLPDTLSGGQQQRIAIARAIVKSPSIILADEPTGNLDEANTVKVMDLIKAISRDRLVILVTHEANLVAHYCDTVIELADGKVSDIRSNSGASGLRVRDKNNIYLSEYERRDIKSSEAEIEYYGDAPDEPLKIRVVNRDGKIYIQVGNPKAVILDSASEIKLVEGSFEGENISEGANERVVDISAIPPLEVKKTGKLFNFMSSLKSGYRENFKGGKRSKKFMRLCLMLFAAVIVFMSATFGTAFTEASKAAERYNKNTFYVYSNDGDVAAGLLEGAKNPDTGIDFISTKRTYPLRDTVISFNAGAFETFNTDTYDVFDNDTFSKPFSANAVMLDTTLTKDLPLLAGRNPEKESEILISSALADKLIENSSLGYVKNYEDTVGFILKTRINNEQPAVCGVVASPESAIYLNPMTLARSLNARAPVFVYPASDYGISVLSGEAICVIAETDVNIPESGEGKVLGMSFKISEKIQINREEDGKISSLSFHEAAYLVSDEDYMELSKRNGDSDSIVSYEVTDYHYTDHLLIPKNILSYAMIHSNNPEATAKWLSDNYGNIETPMRELPALMTPGAVYDEMISEYKSEIFIGAVSIIVVILLMSLCMYFIMRSSLISRIKEVGIYRAIGVSKKNLVFKFFAEALLLALLTVFIGYILSGAFIYACLGISSLVSSIFYYPLWMAASILLILIAVTIFAGILPVLLLLRKTPSEILAKYDI